MAKVILIGLEQSTANQIRRALQGDRHDVELQPSGVNVADIIHADIVFADGSAKGWLPLLRGIRRERPTLPFVFVTSAPETTNWLDALEAGATDYCSAPFEPRQISWVMESAMRRPKIMAA